VATATRQTAAARKEDVLSAAIEEFATAGFRGASTDAIARKAGISQPYLFRLFSSKKELYLASVRRCFRRTLEEMQSAAEGLRGEQALEAMGKAYGQMLSSDPLMLQGQLQTYAAALDDEDVRLAVREGYGDLFAYAERVAGASDARLARFFATGMLLNVIAAMGLHEDASPEPWVERLLSGCRESSE